MYAADFFRPIPCRILQFRYTAGFSCQYTLSSLLIWVYSEFFPPVYPFLPFNLGIQRVFPVSIPFCVFWLGYTASFPVSIPFCVFWLGYNSRIFAAYTLFTVVRYFFVFEERPWPTGEKWNSGHGGTGKAMTYRIEVETGSGDSACSELIYIK